MLESKGEGDWTPSEEEKKKMWQRPSNIHHFSINSLTSQRGDSSKKREKGSKCPNETTGEIESVSTQSGEKENGLIRRLFP